MPEVIMQYEINEGDMVNMKRGEELIRCRNCKYVLRNSDVVIAACKHPNGLVKPKLDSYCSYGVENVRTKNNRRT